MNVGSLHEMIGTYAGLEIQWLMRSVLWGIMPVIMLYVCMIVIMRDISLPAFRNALPQMGKYLATSFLIIAALWAPGPAVTPADDIVSAIAEADGAPVQNAAQFRSAKGLESLSIPVSPWLYVILQEISAKWLYVARVIHEAALRPQAGLMPLNWLMRYKVNGASLFEIQDWIGKCVNPAYAAATQADDVLSYQDSMPFIGTPVYDEMANIRVARGQGVLNLLRQPILCTQYANEIERRVVQQIQTQQTPGGQSMAAVWEEELGISTQDAARFIIMREIQLTNGNDIPPPSLVGKYLGVKSVGVIAKGAAGAVGSVLGPKVGAAAGAASATAGEVGQALDRLGGIIGTGIFAARYGSVLMGWGQTFVLGIGWPMAILLALGMPGRQLTPLVAVLGMTVVVYCSPFVFAVMELWAHSIADSSVSIGANPVAWADKQIAIIVVQSLWPLGVGMVALAVAGAGYGILRIVRG